MAQRQHAPAPNDAGRPAATGRPDAAPGRPGGTPGATPTSTESATAPSTANGSAPSTADDAESGTAGGDGALRADCSRCFGLCCVALPFAASADFPVDKPAGRPCANLRADFRCGIHADLRGQGFSGCTVFDCFGAGQQVSEVTFGGRDWRRVPETARLMFDVFAVARQVHEVLWYLTQALEMAPARPLHGELRRAADETRQLTRADADTLAAVDVGAPRQSVNPLLLRASQLVRDRAVTGRKKNRRGADLVGARLAGTSLRGANLRGALLIAADLTGADLRAADLIGADLRDTALHGADLTGALFLTQAQLNAARGNARTTLPAGLTHPGHW